MFCPVCGVEYRSGFSECADCRVPLTETPPQTRPRPEGRLVKLIETADHSYIPVVKSVLDSAGIPYFVQGEEASHMFSLGTVGAGIRLLRAIVHVHEEDFEEASALLGSAPEAELPEPEEE